MSTFRMSPRHRQDFDLNNSRSSEEEEDIEEQEKNGSDEDTADASEGEEKKRNAAHNGGKRLEIKEQMYQDKLAQIKKHMAMLQEGSLPEFLKRTKKIEIQYRERLRIAEVAKSVDIEKADKNYQVDCANAQKEFEEKQERLKERLLDHLKEKKADLKDSLVCDLKEKRNVIEIERQTIDLNGADFMENKPTMTRKLRRRPNDPIPLPEKRRKPTPAQINLLLDDEQIVCDMKVLMKVAGKPVAKKTMGHQGSGLDTPSSEVRIEDGRLWYDKKWFQRNSMVQVDNKESGSRIYGTISNIGMQEIWIKRSGDNSKLRIYISQLHKGKYSMKKRAT